MNRRAYLCIFTKDKLLGSHEVSKELFAVIGVGEDSSVERSVNMILGTQAFHSGRV